MRKDITGRRSDRREKAMSIAVRRKEEYLGARVPKELRDKVIQKAKNMGIPVSILIRNILEDAFVGDDAGVGKVGVFEDALFEDVIGWDEIILSKSINCAGCGVQLAVAQRAALGLGGDKPIVVCDSCKNKL